MELLEQAGYTKGADGYYLTLTLDVFSGGTYADCGKVIQANLKEAGINLQLNVMEMAAWAEKISAGNYQLGIMAGYQGPDPDAMAKRIGTGAVMTMPGLPKVPAAVNIDVDENGKITGLF